VIVFSLGIFYLVNDFFHCHRLNRVPIFLSNRQNWNYPTPSHAKREGGGGEVDGSDVHSNTLCIYLCSLISDANLLAGKGVGEFPILTTGKKT